MVHVLDDAVDGVCQFAFFVEVDQKPEMTPRVDTSEGTLDVAGDGRVDVEAGCFVAAERRGVVLGVLVPEEKLSSAEG